MRSAIVWILLLAMAGGALYFAVSNGIVNIGVNATVCRKDDEIDSALRREATETATAFFNAIVKDDASAAGAYEALSGALKSSHSAAAFAENAKQIRDSGPFSNLRLDHLYEQAVTGASGHAMCSGYEGAGRWITFDALAGTTQVYALMLATTQNNDWAFVVWMVKDGGAWRVQSYYLSLATMVGLTPGDLLTRAREQEAKGHLLNAQMLYVAAQALTNRGPSVQLGIKQEIDADVAKHKPAPELTGTAPYIWHIGGTDYSVEKIEILGVDKQLLLTLMWRDPAWDGKDMDDADRRNKAFLDAFIKAHPENRETFGALVARILPKDGEHGWGTVFDNSKGYLK